MPPRDKPERGLETPRQARLTVMCIFGVLLFLATVFGALIVVARARGIPIWQSGLGPVLLLNLLFSVSFNSPR